MSDARRITADELSKRIREDLLERALSELPIWVRSEPAGPPERGGAADYFNSTIVYLDVPMVDGSSERLVYKLRHQDHDVDWFERNLETTNQAVRRLRKEGIQAAPILAADPSANLLVTLFIPGEIMTAPSQWSATLRSSEKPVYAAIGHACRTIERSTPPSREWFDPDAVWSDFEHRLAGCGVDRGLERQLSDVARHHFERAVRDGDNVVMANSEIAPNNVVVSGESVGLIDLNLIAALRGYTLARILHRVRFAPFVPTPAHRQAESSIKASYGLQPDDDSHRFTSIDRLVRGLAPVGAVGSLSPRRRRVLRRLKSALG